MIDNSRCRTGIDLVDSELNGGFPNGSTILVCGGSGVGKTTFSMQFLINGIKYNDKGIFFTSTETIEKIRKFQGSYNYFDEKFGTK